MRFMAALRGVRSGQRKVVRLQRRLWLAELALWPTAIVGVPAKIQWPASRHRYRHAGTGRRTGVSRYGAAATRRRCRAVKTPHEVAAAMNASACAAPVRPAG